MGAMALPALLLVCAGFISMADAQCRPIDLAIVVDVSPAEDDLLHLQTFVASLVDLIDVGEDQNRLSIVSAGEVLLSLDEQFDDAETIVSKIVPQPKDMSLAVSLRVVHDQIFDDNNPAYRSGIVPGRMLVVTDKLGDIDEAQVRVAAEQLRLEDIELFVVHVNPDDAPDFTDIVSGVRHNTIDFAEFSDLVDEELPHTVADILECRYPDVQDSGDEDHLGNGCHHRDIIFLVDGSDVAGVDVFQSSLEYVISLIEMLDLGDDRVALVTVAQEQTVVFQLDSSRRADDLVMEIMQLSYFGGQSNSHIALANVANMFMPGNGARAQYVLWFSSIEGVGAANSAIKTAVADLETRDVEVVAVGLGKDHIFPDMPVDLAALVSRVELVPVTDEPDAGGILDKLCHDLSTTTSTTEVPTTSSYSERPDVVICTNACPLAYEPVCLNGVTYANECHARCTSKSSHLMFGTCESQADNMNNDTVGQPMSNDISFDLDMETGILKLYTTLPINTADIVVTDLILQNDTKAPTAGLQLQKAIILFPPPEQTMTSRVEIQLTLQELDLLKQEQIGRTPEVTVLRVPSQWVSFEMSRTEFVTVTNLVRDEDSPSVMFYDFDFMDNVRMILVAVHFTEAIAQESLNEPMFRLSDATGTSFVELPYNSGRSDQGARAVLFTLNADVVDRIEGAGIDISQGEVYLTVLPEGATDYVGNSLMVQITPMPPRQFLVNGRVLKTNDMDPTTDGNEEEEPEVEFTLQWYFLDLSMATLTFVFDQPVTLTSFRASKFALHASRSVNAEFYVLQGGRLSQDEEMLQIVMQLTSMDTDGIKSVTGLADGPRSVLLSIGQEAVQSVHGVHLPSVSVAEALEPAVFIPDRQRPHLVAFSMNMTDNTLAMTFSESMKAGTFRPVDNIALQDHRSHPQNRFHISGHEVSRVSPRVLVVRLSQSDINFLRSGDIGSDVESTYLVMTQFLVEDSSGNSVLPVSDLNAVQVTELHNGPFDARVGSSSGKSGLKSFWKRHMLAIVGSGVGLAVVVTLFLAYRHKENLSVEESSLEWDSDSAQVLAPASSTTSLHQPSVAPKPPPRDLSKMTQTRSEAVLKGLTPADRRETDI